MAVQVACRRSAAISTMTTRSRSPRTNKSTVRCTTTTASPTFLLRNVQERAFSTTKTARFFHTYSAYARGLDTMLNAYNFLDLTPKGRDEAGLGPYPMAWVRHHDRYSDGKMFDVNKLMSALG